MMSSPTPAGGPSELFSRALDQLRRTLKSLADEMRPIESGWVVRTRSLPRVWTLNQLLICEPVTFADAIALADRHQADLPYRHVVVEAEPTSRQLEGSFVAAGWHVDCEVLMALAGSSDREVDTRAVIELSEAQMLELMRRWTIEEHPAIGTGLEELEEYSRREGRLWNEQCFGILDVDGAPAAITKLRSDGATAWVEDVYTVPEARGRGYARVLVTHATALARSAEPDLIFIIADDNDWPKHLYADIGFRPIGTTRTFHRDLGAASRRTW
jgi:GNAT superfamily N-acetyltransferase